MNASADVVSGQKAMLLALIAEIAECDNVLDSVGDGVAASKRAVLTELIEQFPDTEENVDKVMNFLRNVDSTFALAIWSALNRKVEKEFGEKFETYLKTEVDKRKELNSGEKVEDSVLTEAAAKRAEAMKKYRAIREVIALFDPSALEGVEEPKVRRGVAAGTKTGPRLKGSWDFFVDDKKIGDVLSKAAKVLGCSTSAFKDAIAAAGVDLKDPKTSRFEFTIGVKTVTAVANQSDDTVADASDDDGDDD